MDATEKISGGKGTSMAGVLAPRSLQPVPDGQRGRAQGEVLPTFGQDGSHVGVLDSLDDSFRDSGRVRHLSHSINMSAFRRNTDRLTVIDPNPIYTTAFSS